MMNKRIVSALIALVMVMSLSVTAFAEGEQSGTSTITATVPEASPTTYTIQIPAATNIPYGTTDWVALNGTVSVSNVENLPDGKLIKFRVFSTNLEDGSGHTIPISYQDEAGDPVLGFTHWAAAWDWQFFAKVPSWDGAVPGTYTATLTFDFFIE